MFVSAPNRANETQTQFAQEFNILDCFIDITVTKPVGPSPHFFMNRKYSLKYIVDIFFSHINAMYRRCCEYWDCHFVIHTEVVEAVVVEISLDWKLFFLCIRNRKA